MKNEYEKGREREREREGKKGKKGDKISSESEAGPFVRSSRTLIIYARNYLKLLHWPKETGGSKD